MLGLWFVAYVVFITVDMTVDKVNVNGLDAAPSHDDQNTENTLLTSLLGFICGTLCKNTPLADIIPAPTDAPQYTMSTKGRLQKWNVVLVVLLVCVLTTAFIILTLLCFKIIVTVHIA